MVYNDSLGLLLLLAPRRRAVGKPRGLCGLRRKSTPADSMVVLAPARWPQVPDAALPGRRGNGREPERGIPTELVPDALRARYRFSDTIMRR